MENSGTNLQHSSIDSRLRRRDLQRSCMVFSLSFSLVFCGLGWLGYKMDDRWSSLKGELRSWYKSSLTFQDGESKPDPLTVPSPYYALHKMTMVPQEISERVPSISQQERVKGLLPDQALTDPLNRISKTFKVPTVLTKRTQFWFDIYTKYDSHTHVIHHTRYPWIVFKIVDTKSLIENGKGPLWLRHQRAEKTVAAERNRVRRVLKRLANKKSFKRLSKEEREIYQVMLGLKGKRKSVFKIAASNIRSQTGQKNFFIKGLRNSSKYLPYMEEEFSSAGLPIELTRMPFVESSFNEEAKSKVGASGIWQFMPRTGRDYMRVNNIIDERNSPLKSTKAAAKILKQYHRTLKDWPLTVTSYNHGIGNIRKAIRGARSRDLGTIISRYHRGSFKFASSNFYACFLAALHAEKYHDVIFPYVARERLLEREVYTLSSSIRIKSFTKITGLSRDQILTYNRDLEEGLKKNILLPKGFEIHLPRGRGASLIQKLTDYEQRKSPQARVSKKSKPSI